MTKGISEFNHLSIALSNAGKRPHKLSVCSVGSSKDGAFREPNVEEGLPPLFACLKMHHVHVNVYRALTHLTLHLAAIQASDALHDSYSLSGLGRLLDSLPYLEHLELVLPKSSSFLTQPYRYDQIFKGKDRRWRRLHTLELCNITISTKDLIRLLQGLPKLRNLRVQDVMLVDGRWEWIVEFMHRSLKLESFEAAWYDNWFQYADEYFYDDDDYEDDDYEPEQVEEANWHFDVIRDYVLRRPGACHPGVYDEKSERDGEDDEDVAAEDDEESKKEKKKKNEKDKATKTALVSQKYFDGLQKFLQKIA